VHFDWKLITKSRMSETRVVVALTNAGIADFFPGEMWRELERLVPGHQRLQLPLAQPEDWSRLWRNSPVDILVAAWQTLTLGSDILPADLTSLRYICYLAGSVRMLVPRALVEQGTVVTNWGGSIGPTVAECTLMLILTALRRASHWAVAKDGKIQIALDVSEVEPLPNDSPLRGLANVTLLPHLGGPTHYPHRDSGQLALKNLRAFLQGEPFEAVISLDIYDRST